MICKSCNAEISEDARFCPCCGENLAAVEGESVDDAFAAPDCQDTVETDYRVFLGFEETEPDHEKAKKAGWKLPLAIAGGVVVLAALAVLLLTALGVDLKPRGNDILKKDVYTVSDEKVEKKKDDEIAKIGDVALTNGQFQIYYQEVVYNFINNNYYYLSSYGLDPEKPLSEQTCYSDEDLTWEQYFLTNALESWQRYTTLKLVAEENGFTLSEDLQTFLNDLPNTIKEVATEGEYESSEAWLEENYGAGVTEADFVGYMTTYYTANEYLESRYEELMPGEEDIEVFYKENEKAFAESGMGKDAGKYYDVRHILIQPEGGTENEKGEVTFSEAEWEACREKAQKLLDEWTGGEKTEESFAELAKKHSADTGSSENGGLYTQLTKETSFVEEFKQWYLDETRAVGDTGLVKTMHGYHIMYFSGSEDLWHYNATTQLLAERISDMIDAGIEANPMEVKYARIVVGDLGL